MFAILKLFVFFVFVYCNAYIFCARYCVCSYIHIEIIVVTVADVLQMLVRDTVVIGLSLFCRMPDKHLLVSSFFVILINIGMISNTNLIVKKVIKQVISNHILMLLCNFLEIVL